MPESALPLRSAEGLRVFKIPTFAKVTSQCSHWLLAPVKKPLDIHMADKCVFNWA
jgi:hypothetical protein